MKAICGIFHALSICITEWLSKFEDSSLLSVEIVHKSNMKTIYGFLLEFQLIKCVMYSCRTTHCVHCAAWNNDEKKQKINEEKKKKTNKNTKWSLETDAKKPKC